MANWTQKDLEAAEEQITAIAAEQGLNVYDREYEICDANEMIGYEAYLGMPSRYPHWSFGKAYERTSTLYRYGVQGLAYELVINSDPCLAYLMRSNLLALQILTMAHAGFGHNDFFKNNRNFAWTQAARTLTRFKAHADRIRSYRKDPSIGPKRVEQLLTAAHALSLNRPRTPGALHLTQDEQQQQAFERMQQAPDEWRQIHQRREQKITDLNRVPLEPEADLLLFIRDRNPLLESWEQDVLTIVAREADYFWPQIETKIMNEGWATFWHHTILNRMRLPTALQMEWITVHNQVVAPPPVGGLNPYRFGFELYKDIERRYGRERIFTVRKVDRDVSFIKQYVTEDFLRRMFFIEYAEDDEELMVTDTVNEDNWRDLRDRLIRNIGSNAIPDIRVYDSNFKGAQTLLLLHCFDGRSLHPEYAHHTLRHIQTLWRRRVHLLTWNMKEDACWLFSAEVDGKVTQHKHCDSSDCPLRAWMQEHGVRKEEDAE